MNDGFIKVAAATPEIVVADTKYNGAKIREIMSDAYSKGVKILVLPELCITGSTCGDLFLHEPLIRGAFGELLNLVAHSADTPGMLTFAGLPVSAGGALYNCSAAFCGGELAGLVTKTNISNRDESRWFSKPAYGIETMRISGSGHFISIGSDITFICEDFPELVVACEIGSGSPFFSSPSARLAQEGATIIVNPTADCEIVCADEYRRNMIKTKSAELICGYVSANAGAGESTTDMVFTGHNFIAENGHILSECETLSGMIISEIDVAKLYYERRRSGFAPNLQDHGRWGWSTPYIKTALTREYSKSPFIPSSPEERAQRFEKILNIQSLGLKKRMEHSGSKRMILGVSGGLDSTLAMLVCTRTADLMGIPGDSVLAVTMPCFGTTSRTKSNAMLLAESLGAELRVVDISNSVRSHFEDIGHDFENKNVVFENAQARERTQVLMDIANGCSGLVVGTGDLSELALGWATYNGDHMCMYGVNAGIPKTLVRHLVAHIAGTCGDGRLSSVLNDILDTPVSPELLPAKDGEISQKTEDLVGPYILHDFFLYHLVRWGNAPSKVYRLARYAFGGEYDADTILHWLKTFCRRFFSQQFKRSCMPDGPMVGTVSLSPRGGWTMPSDASASLWLTDLDSINPAD